MVGRAWGDERDEKGKQRMFRVVKLPYNADTWHYALSKLIECTPRVKPNVNYGLGVITDV